MYLHAKYKCLLNKHSHDQIKLRLTVLTLQLHCLNTTHISQETKITTISIRDILYQFAQVMNHA